MKHRILLLAAISFLLTILFLTPAESHSLQITGNPGLRGGHGMVYDPHNQVCVIFGGLSFEGGIHSLGDTWAYDYSTNSWVELESISSPSSRSALSIVYCSETNEIILYGGSGVTDTWSFDCESQTWSEVETSTNPGSRYSHAMAYDSQNDVVILFGGFDGDGWVTDETWQFNCTSREWSQISTTTQPLARYGHVMVYDDVIHRVILTCGNTAFEGHQDDTWEFAVTSGNWTEIETNGNPDQLKWPSMTYDSLNKKCILFGGQIGDNSVNGTWIYDAQSNTWTYPEPDDPPTDRITSGIAFNSQCGVVILYGGMMTGGTQLGDTWAYRLASNVWTDLSIQNGNCTIQSTTVETSTHTTTLIPTTSTTSQVSSTSSSITSEPLPFDYFPIVLVSIGSLTAIIIIIGVRKKIR